MRATGVRPPPGASSAHRNASANVGCTILAVKATVRAAHGLMLIPYGGRVTRVK
jgi:hypothetical protein